MSVLVYTEINKGRVKKASLECVNYAAKIAALTGSTAVSYTHLDVYKRKLYFLPPYFCTI